jgi:hypothetical protein
VAIDSNRVAGISRITVDGRSELLAGDLTYSMARVTRESKIGQDKVHGFSEMPIPGFIACTLRDRGGLSVAELNAMTNVTVVVEAFNGKIITGSGMWTVETQEVSGTEGTIGIRWEGVSVEEV